MPPGQYLKNAIYGGFSYSRVKSTFIVNFMMICQLNVVQHNHKQETYPDRLSLKGFFVN